MSARINLAPEVYQQHQREKQLRRVVTGGIVSLATTFGIAIAILVVVIGGQTAGIAALTDNIHKKQAQIKTYSDLSKAVTVSDHLKSLQQLTDDKTYPSQFFAALQTYMPQGVGLSNATIDEGGSMTVTASADSYPLVTKLAKAFEGANVTVGPNAAATNSPYFSDIEITGASQGQSKVTFQMKTVLSKDIELHGNK